MTSFPPPESVPVALRHALSRVRAGCVLNEEEARLAFLQVMAGDAPAPAIGELLLALRARGEAASELAGVVAALRGTMLRVPFPSPSLLVDTCGTGGGLVRTLNVSTAAAFVAAGAGVPVAKHGNRSFTSRSGSADVLEALGVVIHVTPARAGEVLAEVGIVFLFAPDYHPAMRHVAGIRRELGVPTIMNLAGPLANPAWAGRQVVGVAKLDQARTMAESLLRLGAAHALVVHGEIGIDEIAPVGLTRVWEVHDGGVEEWCLDPADLGLDTPTLAGLEGGEPAENAARIRALFSDPASAPPALRSAVLLNAAAAIYVGGACATWPDAVSQARRALDSGAALARLETLIAVSSAG
jgi:anthranilate phosphoribosyltransferase